MKNWIIKLLGGFTFDEYSELLKKWSKTCDNYYVLEAKLKQARKNDTPRDPETGRFVKK